MIVRRPWARLLPVALAPVIIVAGLALPVVDLPTGSTLADRPAFFPSEAYEPSTLGVSERDEQFGLETMCVGGGQGMAMLVVDRLEVVDVDHRHDDVTAAGDDVTGLLDEGSTVRHLGQRTRAQIRQQQTDFRQPQPGRRYSGRVPQNPRRPGAGV